MAVEKDNTMYWVAAAVLLLVIILLLMFWKKNQSPKPPSGNNTESNGTVFDNTQNLDFNRILRKGVTGNEVKLLQAWLGVSIDGIFGPVTEAALLAKKGVAEITLNQYANAPNADAGVNDNTWQGYSVLPMNGNTGMPSNNHIFETGITATITWQT
ncbi:MAG: hypothetical protein KIS94_05585 [Chitinophagales bacterium]|nr:hypothetical protein [Chitinophagales bacterium]